MCKGEHILCPLALSRPYWDGDLSALAISSHLRAGLRSECPDTDLHHWIDGDLHKWHWARELGAFVPVICGLATRGDRDQRDRAEDSIANVVSTEERTATALHSEWEHKTT